MTKTEQRMQKNAEVSGGKVRRIGTKAAEQKTVTVNETPTGVFKKRLMYSLATVSAIAIYVGLYVNWEPGFEHGVWANSVIYGAHMLVIRLSKME